MIGKNKVQKITHVRIAKFDGTQAIEGVFDRSASKRRNDGRLILRFSEGRLVSPSSPIKFMSRNPVSYT